MAKYIQNLFYYKVRLAANINDHIINCLEPFVLVTYLLVISEVVNIVFKWLTSQHKAN